MIDVLPREEIAWVGAGLLALGGGVALPGSVLLARALWRRARLDPRYSPVARGRAALLVLAGVWMAACGAGSWWFGGALEPWDPVREGEPVGLLEIRGDRLTYRSAISGTYFDLGPRPRGRVVLVGDVLTFPGWARLLGLGSFHRVRQVEQPLGLLSLPEEDASRERLQELVARSWFPGEHRSFAAPAVDPGRGSVTLTLLPEGGYGAWEHPGAP